MNRTLCTSLHKHSQTRMVPANEHLPSAQRERVSNLSLLIIMNLNNGHENKL